MKSRFFSFLFFVLFFTSCCFSIDYLDGKEVFFFEVSSITQEDDSYLVPIKISNLAEGELTFDLEVIVEGRNLVLEQFSFNCNYDCKEFVELPKLEGVEYKFLVTTKYQGLFYRQEKKMSFEDFDSYVEISLDSQVFDLSKISTPQLSGALKFSQDISEEVSLEVLSEDFLVLQEEVLSCKGNFCKFSFELEKPYLLEKYSLLVYSSLGEERVEFYLNFENLSSFQQEFEEISFEENQSSTLEEFIFSKKNIRSHLTNFSTQDQNFLAFKNNSKLFVAEGVLFFKQEYLDGSSDLIYLDSFEANRYTAPKDVTSISSLVNEQERVQLKPTLNSLHLEKQDYGLSYNQSNDEYYVNGLLSFNTQKPLYSPQEFVEVFIVVLDAAGIPVPDANVTFEVKTPSGEVWSFSTQEKTVFGTTTPGVYTVFFQVDELGSYELYGTSELDSFRVQFKDEVSVVDSVEFDILRNIPHTIDPWQGSTRAEFSFKSYLGDFIFNFQEKFSSNLELLDTDATHVEIVGDELVLSWQGLYPNSTPYYVFQAPLKTPDFYELGPSEVISDFVVLQENRSFNLAIDPLLVDETDASCSDTFGSPCSDWPATSEADNTFDTCANSVGGAADEHVQEVIVSQKEALLGSQLEVSCQFKPYSTGTEEYIYYYNGQVWSQIYAGNAPDGNVHIVSQNITVNGNYGTQYVRCIVDWDGENDECANQGSYYDNDDASFIVVNPFLELLSPLNQSYPSAGVQTEIETTQLSNISYRIDGKPFTQVCSNCSNVSQLDFYVEGQHQIEVEAVNVLSGEINYWREFFTVLSSQANPPINSSLRTCTSTFGADCSLWPSSSEGDNTFDACPTSIGGAGDEHVIEVLINQSSAYSLDEVEVTCVFDPYSTGTEEYIYYYNTTSWTQLYSGNAPSGDIHNVSVSTSLSNVSGTHWFRCIVDWDGENDECANLGSYYDNDDASINVLEYIENPPFILGITEPKNQTYTSTTIDLDFLISPHSTLDYSINSESFIQACVNCSEFSGSRILRDGQYTLVVRAYDVLLNKTTFENVTFTIESPTLPSINTTQRTCSDAFGFTCGNWPSSSEGDNTFDTCPTSIGGASDENVVEVLVNTSVAEVGNQVEVTCVFDPFDTGTEEYIYYYNSTGWTQLYSGNAPSGDVHNVSAVVGLANTSGVSTHWFRCIVDWDGENDECANQGSYYDNDDVNITVIRPVVLPFDLTVFSPVNGSSYFNASLNLDISTTKLANISYSINGGPLIDVCSNCTNYNESLLLPSGDYELLVRALDLETFTLLEKNVTFSYILPVSVIYDSFNGSTTNFSQESNISNVCNPILEILSYGKIEYNECVDVENSDLDSFVTITRNEIGVNSQVLPNFNKSANLSFYNVSFIEPLVLYDNKFSTQHTFISYLSNVYSIGVSFFSNYKLVENRSLEVFDSSDFQSVFIDEQHSFFVNYSYVNGSVVTDATCKLRFNLSQNWTSATTMSYNSSSSYYEYNQSFSQAISDELFEVNCTHSSFPDLVLNDTFTITNPGLSIQNLQLYSSNFTNTTNESLICSYDLISGNSSWVLWNKNGVSQEFMSLPFEGNATLALEDLRRNYDVSVTGATWNSNGYFSFDGDDDYLDFGDVDEFDTSSSFTYIVKFRRTADNSGTTADTNHQINNVLLAQSSQNSNDNLEIGTEGTNLEMYFDASANYNLVADLGFVNDVWYHLAITFDSSLPNDEVKVYLDGVNVANFSDTTAPLDNSGTTPLSLGIARPDRGDPWGDFQGDIDLFEAYTRALSSQEIQTKYFNSSQVFSFTQTNPNDKFTCEVYGFNQSTRVGPFSSNELQIMDTSDLSIQTINLSSEFLTNTTNEDLFCDVLPSTSALNYSSLWYKNNQPWHLLQLPFEGNLTTALKDISGNNLIGTLAGDVDWNVSSGIKNGALFFDGVDDYVDFGDINSLDTRSELGISFWFKRSSDVGDSTNHNVENVMVAQASGSNNDNLEIGTSGTNLEIYFDSSGTDSLSVDAGIVNDVWYHLALSYDEFSGDGLQVYLDGVSIANFTQVSGPLRASNAAPFSLGLSRTDNQLWGDYHGYLDELIITREAISKEQVLNYYTNSDRLSFQQTFSKDSWQCGGVAFSNESLSFTKLSNELTIKREPSAQLSLTSSYENFGGGNFSVSLRVENQETLETIPNQHVNVFMFVPQNLTYYSYTPLTSTYYVDNLSSALLSEGEIIQIELLPTNSDDASLFGFNGTARNSTNYFEANFSFTSSGVYSFSDLVFGLDPQEK